MMEKKLLQMLKVKEQLLQLLLIQKKGIYLLGKLQSAKQLLILKIHFTLLSALLEEKQAK